VDAEQPEQSRWFRENLLPHEQLLRSWLLSRFCAGSDVDDIVQEAYVRVLGARTEEMRNPKAFLFATARNLAVDRLRRRPTAGSPLADSDALSVMDEGPGAPEVVSHAEELELLKQAIQSLPERCRQVITLRKVHGLSQKETAARLGIAEHTVEVQSAIGLRKCTAFFAKHEQRLHG
jgi:RNA polymerase sigma-70 factor (ECF subfamily)